MVQGSVKKPVTPDVRKYKIGDLIGDRYEIQQIHGGEGKSSMGVVYVCFDHKSNVILALKTLQDKFLNNPRLVASFKKEAFAWIHLENHPNIVKAFWAKEFDGRLFVASEYIQPDEHERNTLTHHLKEPLSINQILDWSYQFLYAMDYAHLRGVTPHRDIKPDNIMIDMEGVLKITDFGLAGIIEDSDEVQSAKGTGTNETGPEFLKSPKGRVVAGSPNWMAPENFYGIAEVRGDIYGFGVVLYQMVADGYPPIQPAGKDNWAYAHKRYPVRPVPDKGKPLEQIILKCLEKHRDKRYPGFAEIISDLETVYKKEVTKKTGAPPPEPPVIEALSEASLSNKGLSMSSLGLEKEGIKHFKEALRSNPKSATLRFNLANAYVKQKKFDDAEHQYKLAAKFDEFFVAPHFNLAMMYMKTGRIDEARKEFEEVILLDPGFFEAHMNLGNIYSKAKEQQLALEAYRAAVSVNPDSALAQNKLGAACFKLKIHSEAAEAFSEAVRLDPQYADAHANLGAVLLGQGENDEAIKAYGKALTLEPQNSGAGYNIGVAFLKSGMPLEAKRAFESFISTAPKNDKRRPKALNHINEINNQT